MNTPLDALIHPFSNLPGEIERSLSEEGFVILRDMVDPEKLLALRATFDEIVSFEGEYAAREHHQEKGARRVANLVNKGRMLLRNACDREC